MKLVTVTVMLDEHTPESIRRMVQTLCRYQQGQAVLMSHGVPPTDGSLGPEHRLLTYEELMGYLRSQNVELPTLRLQTNTSSIWNALMRVRNTVPLVVACENCRRLMYRCTCPGNRGAAGTPTPAVTLMSLKASLKWLDEHDEVKLDLSKHKRAQLQAWVQSIEE